MNTYREEHHEMNQLQSSELDLATSSTWIFPHSHQFIERQYQFQIAQTSLLSNTLVCLPTGLGKTLIAAVVMYNYVRNHFYTASIIFII